jgi:hypothetical protein
LLQHIARSPQHPQKTAVKGFLDRQSAPKCVCLSSGDGDDQFCVPDIDDRLEDNIDSSSTSRDDGSITQKGRRSGSVKVTLEKLRVRRILREPSADSRLRYLNSILTMDLLERPLKDIKGLRSVAANFL